MIRLAFQKVLSISSEISLLRQKYKKYTMFACFVLFQKLKVSKIFHSQFNVNLRIKKRVAI
jgi:hypothetical protein